MRHFTTTCERCGEQVQVPIGTLEPYICKKHKVTDKKLEEILERVNELYQIINDLRREHERGTSP